ncbi:MAG: hypothetical protein FJ220_02145, partial [Kiritimatiellaceae bacterium]|nr:hypothetical protein [Kiritimatiellaceae bacterium]
MKKVYSFLIGAILSTAMPVVALVLNGGTGALNSTAPTDDPGWGNVGSIRAGKPGKSGSRAGAIYLGDKWFITAQHIYDLDGPTGVVVGAVCYTVDSNSWTRLKNTISPNAGSNTDLTLFRVTTQPAAPALRIRSSAVSSGASVVMIGNGYSRQTNLVYWTAGWQLTNAASGV